MISDKERNEAGKVGGRGFREGRPHGWVSLDGELGQMRKYGGRACQAKRNREKGQCGWGEVRGEGCRHCATPGESPDSGPRLKEAIPPAPISRDTQKGEALFHQEPEEGQDGGRRAQGS